MAENPTPKDRDWPEIMVKALTPIVAGIVIALVGYWSNQTLTNISSREESARLVTQLQVERERAESELRKDVFDKALQALFRKDQDDGSIQSLSKRLLRLELLALNFGDTLSLSPLFNEFRRDLEIEERDKTKGMGYKLSIRKLRSRLISLARRVASGQLSSLEQQGKSLSITVPLPRKAIRNADTCSPALFISDEYKWPQDVQAKKLKVVIDTWERGYTFSKDVQEGIEEMLSGEYIPLEKIFVDRSNKDNNEEKDADTRTPLDTELESELRNDIKKILREYDLTFEEITRRVKVNVSNVEPCTKTATVALEIQRIDATEKDRPVCRLWSCWQQTSLENGRDLDREPEVEREFNLDFFNFPLVDNTRLSNNHRFALVMEDFETENIGTHDPQLVLSGVIFPAEYASLRDRPGMKEAMQLLQSAMRQDSPDSATSRSESSQERQ